MSHPTVCNWCGHQYMPHTIDPNAPKLCNNCINRQPNTTKKRDTFMSDETVIILINCPKKAHEDIEEFCMRNGVDLTTFFMNLYNNSFSKTKVVEQEEEVEEKKDQFSPTKKLLKSKNR